MLGQDFDVTKNIKMTEDLQCELLSSVAEIFQAMNKNVSKSEKAELLANTEILLCLLAGRMGISKATLDQKAIARLRVGLVNEDRTEWKTSLLQLLHELEKGL